MLLFTVQPLFTKMVLPMLGGSAATWNTAVVFFQTMLFAGYLYVHIITRVLTFQLQALLHIVLLASAFFVLPVATAAGWTSPGDTSPVVWLIGLLAVSIGLPLFAVSTTAPLLQSWFARTGHKSAADPYFLYGASNLGSFVALLSYPFVVEPLLGLGQQGQIWAWGYAALAAFICLVVVSVRRGAYFSTPVSGPVKQIELVDQIDWKQRIHWLLLAFFPVSLLLGVTLHISTNIAATPFLWTLPLAIYLLSFVLVFARKPILKHAWMLKLQIFVVIALVIQFWNGTLWLLFLLHLLGLFVMAMVCHGELAKRRPAARHLTEFYLWMSFGGLLGGIASVLVAPLLFDNVLEYPLALIIACALRPVLTRGGRGSIVADLTLPFAVALLVLWSEIQFRIDPLEFGEAGRLGFLGAIAVGLFLFRLRPMRFALGITAVLFVPLLLADSRPILTQERSFFGTYRVETVLAGRFNFLWHGNTVHGVQATSQLLRKEPLSYFSRQGPLGQFFAALNQQQKLTNIGVVGLGIGTIACYRRPGQAMTFFEIDPEIERLARNPQLFNYLAECGDGVEVQIGDGRLSLAAMPNNHFDLIVLDAFSSDSIPVHMITREALNLYLEKLADGGVVAFHISNKFLDLEPVMANLVLDAGLAGLVQRHDFLVPRSRAPRSLSTILASKWAVVGRTQEDLALLARDSRWRPLTSPNAKRPWTDDYSNVFGALIWKLGL